MCGASNEQKQTYQEQSQLFKQMTSQASQVFNLSSGVFNDLVSAFAPIVAAGPSQEGLSPVVLAALNSAAITNVGTAYEHARQAVGEQTAAQGGGNIALPSGVADASRIALAEASAGETAKELTDIKKYDYDTGRQNFFAAAQTLGGAPQAFNPSTGAGNAATGAGSATASTANEIAQANNSWQGMVGGILGGAASAVVSGGMANLGKGVGFFG